jgi:dolichol-phosphate mannosyltransferase
LLLSRGGNIYIRTALGMPFTDATGGYRAYRIGVLDEIDVATIASTGYSFQVEMAWRAYRQGFRMVEVPITFTEREHGVSKMSGNVFKEQLLRVTLWGLQARRESLVELLTGGERTPAEDGSAGVRARG